MPLAEVIFVLVIVGMAMWLINAYVPMAPNIKTLLNWVVILVLVAWILNVFGFWAYLGLVKVPRLR